MIKLVFPEPDFRLKMENDRRYIFDQQRKSWILLTEEEWVRQNFLAFLLKDLQYPASMIAVEKEILLHGLKKRFDILIYNENHQPWMMVECKAPVIELNEKVLRQVLVYNQSVPVQYFVITNGSQTMGWVKKNEGLELMNEMPFWKSAPPTGM